MKPCDKQVTIRPSKDDLEKKSLLWTSGLQNFCFFSVI